MCGGNATIFCFAYIRMTCFSRTGWASTRMLLIDARVGRFFQFLPRKPLLAIAWDKDYNGFKERTQPASKKCKKGKGSTMDMSQAFRDGFIWSLLWAAVIALTIWKAPQQLVITTPRNPSTCGPASRKQEDIQMDHCSGTRHFDRLSVFQRHRNLRRCRSCILGTVLHIFVMCIVWNSVDLLVMDWLIFCTIQPKFMILPGSEGHPAYKDYYFHFRGFLIGCVYSAIGGVVCGGIGFAVLKLFYW